MIVKFEAYAKWWVPLYLLICYLNFSVSSIPELRRYLIFLWTSTKWIVVNLKQQQQPQKSHLLYVDEPSEGFVPVFIFIISFSKYQEKIKEQSYSSLMLPLEPVLSLLTRAGATTTDFLTRKWKSPSGLKPAERTTDHEGR